MSEANFEPGEGSRSAIPNPSPASQPSAARHPLPQGERVHRIRVFTSLEVRLAAFVEGAHAFASVLMLDREAAGTLSSRGETSDEDDSGRGEHQGQRPGPFTHGGNRHRGDDASQQKAEQKMQRSLQAAAVDAHQRVAA